MKTGPDIAHIAALIGDPARANILTALMSGKALTATELAGEAGVTLQTTSTHLAKLQAGGLITPRKSGRHKYFTLTSDDVAGVLEALMGLAAGSGHLRNRPGPRDPELRHARVCYNHLAGDLGTRAYAMMHANGLIREGRKSLQLTPDGERFFIGIGIDLAALPAPRTPMCRACLDWSERRSHLAGRLGRGLLTHMLDQGWAGRVTGTRIIRFSTSGRAEFDKLFPPDDQTSLHRA